MKNHTKGKPFALLQKKWYIEWTQSQQGNEFWVMPIEVCAALVDRQVGRRGFLLGLFILDKIDAYWDRISKF